MDWHLGITRQIITPDLTSVPLCEEMEYRPHGQQIQNSISI
jgi:hypothetical protein